MACARACHTECTDGDTLARIENISFTWPYCASQSGVHCRRPSAVRDPGIHARSVHAADRGHAPRQAAPQCTACRRRRGSSPGIPVRSLALLCWGRRPLPSHRCRRPAHQTCRTAQVVGSSNSTSAAYPRQTSPRGAVVTAFGRSNPNTCAGASVAASTASCGAMPRSSTARCTACSSSSVEPAIAPLETKRAWPSTTRTSSSPSL